MDTLNQVHFLYQYSLRFFLDIFNSVLLHNKQLTEITDYGQRLTIITKQLFDVSFFGKMKNPYCIEFFNFLMESCTSLSFTKMFRKKKIFQKKSPISCR